MKKFTYQLDRLKGGLRVLRVPVETDSVMTLCLANTGSRYEKAAEWGIAHFFEHMVFKGTAKYPTAKEIAVKIDGIGANFNAFTSEEYTGYYIHGAARHLPLALDMVAEMLLQPRLDQAEIDRERGVILEEMNMYIDDPRSHLQNQFQQMVYAGSGLGHDVIGTKATVQAINREHFVSFLRSWYGLDNLVLVLAGRKKTLNDPDLLTQVAEIFGQKKYAPRAEAVSLHKWLRPDFRYGERLRVEFRETEQAHFILGWPSYKLGDERKYALGLLKVILGANMSSRLFTEVREKRGLCYYVGSFTETNRDSGQFGAMAGVSLTKIEEALRVTIGEFGQIAAGEKPITEDELQRAKDYVEGKTVLSLEDGVGVGESFGFQQLLEGKIELPHERWAKIKKVTVEEVMAVAADLVKKDELRLAVIGPYKKKLVFEQILSNI
jgi:predicted Zn-dependent peptidase